MCGVMEDLYADKPSTQGLGGFVMYGSFSAKRKCAFDKRRKCDQKCPAYQLKSMPRIIDMVVDEYSEDANWVSSPQQFIAPACGRGDFTISSRELVFSADFDDKDEPVWECDGDLYPADFRKKLVSLTDTQYTQMWDEIEVKTWTSILLRRSTRLWATVSTQRTSQKRSGAKDTE